MFCAFDGFQGNLRISDTLGYVCIWTALRGVLDCGRDMGTTLVLVQWFWYEFSGQSGHGALTAG